MKKAEEVMEIKAIIKMNHDFISKVTTLRNALNNALREKHVDPDIYSLMITHVQQLEHISKTAVGHFENRLKVFRQPYFIHSVAPFKQTFYGSKRKQ